jgi:hypothetical protein
MRQRHRVEEWPRGGGADLLRRLAGQAGEDAQRRHVRMLALARAHADGREALQQLDVVVALLHGVFEVLQLQVFVEIDEILAIRMGDDGPGVRRGFGFRRHVAASALAEAGMRRGVAAGAPAIGHARLHAVGAIHPATGEHALGQHIRARTAAGRRRNACFVPAWYSRLAAGAQPVLIRSRRNRCAGREAATTLPPHRHGDGDTGQQCRDRRHGLDTACPASIRRPVCAARRIRAMPDGGAQIHHGGHGDRLGQHIERDPIAVGVGHQHHGLFAGLHGISGRSGAAWPASMTPGRSLLRNTAGCSNAPLATTTLPARILVMRSALDQRNPVSA